MENKDSGKLGLVACIAILTGGCIGSAIFSLSGMTMYYAGPAAIITWIVAAIILGCYGVQVISFYQCNIIQTTTDGKRITQLI